ncbi:MAG: ABC transporter permease [Planctomycetota bacterium]|jgi:hypothetical protein
MWSSLFAVARSGLTAVLLHPLRSATAVACVVSVLVPYVCGAAIARGVRAEALVAIDAGAELQVTRLQFGRPAPIPLSTALEFESIPGVREAVPRIVGELALGIDLVPVVLVGMPRGRIPVGDAAVQRSDSAPEFIVGAELARRLKLEAGSLLPPFYHSKGGERVSRVVGVLSHAAPLSSGYVMYTSFETASEIFDETGLATDVLIACAPGYRDAVRVKLEQSDPTLSVTTRDELRAQLPVSLRHLDGIFQIHFALAFAIGIPLLLVASGIGLVERRREAALLKATGWMTDELLLRTLVESLVLCLLASSIAVIGAWAWLEFGNGAGIAGIFLPGWETGSAMRVPYRLGVEASLVASILSLCVVATGSLYSTWRVATAPPSLVLR